MLRRRFRHHAGPVALAIVALLPAVRGHAQESPPAAQEALPAAWRPVIDRFAERIAADVATDTVGGITAAVVRDGRIVWVQGFGWADRDARTPASAETIYRIGSISKSFTAVALAQLAQAEALSLDDAVTRYLPEAAGFAEARTGAPPVTLRHLATHTAGIIREPRLDGAASGPIGQWEAKVLASIPATRFDTVPGARYAYSNIGYGVLGLAISRAARMSFMDLVQSRIFEPADMTSSTFVITPALRPRLAVGYSNGRRGIDAAGPAREHDGRGYKVPNGGIYSTAADLARFIGALDGSLGDVVLDARTRAEVLRVQTPENPRRGYGLGFSIRTLDSGRHEVSHGGSVAGYTAHLVFDPDARTGVILLRNYNSGSTSLGAAASALLAELVASQ